MDIFFILLLTNSCETDDPLRDYSPEIMFDNSNHLLPGKHIACIETDSKRDIWIGTANNGVFVLNQ